MSFNPTAPQTSTRYWSSHNVSAHKVFQSPKESLDYFHWRNAQYIDYINLLPVSGHDGEIIVDFGCGPGNDVIGFLEYSKPEKVYGFDVSAPSLSECDARVKLHGFSAELRQLSAQSPVMPLGDNSVDYLHCSGVLMLLPDPIAALSEFYRVLRPSGYSRLMVYEYNSIWTHLYAAYKLRTEDDRYRDLSLEEAFKRSTDGYDCPINRSWQVDGFIELGRSVGFNVKHLGNAISLFEMSLLNERFLAMIDPMLCLESRDFLSRIVFDNRGIPYVDGQVAGIDACYELRK